MSRDESPFLDLGDLQGWLAAMGSALKHSSELLMLTELRDICRIYGARNREWRILSWRYSMSLKF